MAQISFNLNGDFWPMITPLFQGACCSWSVVFSMMDSSLIEGVRLWADCRVAQTYFLRQECGPWSPPVSALERHPPT